MQTTEVLKELNRTAPYQPATNYWRVVELDAIAKAGLPAGRGLDLGCGDGKLTSILDRIIPDDTRVWIGVDPDYEETRLAIKCGLYHTVHTCLGDNIPEASGSLDFILSNSVLEHIPDVEPVIGEISRLLKPGGRLIFTVPSENFHNILSGPPLGVKNSNYLTAIDNRLAHYRYWTISEWKDCLARHDLKIKYNFYYLTSKQLRRWELISNFTGGLLYSMFGRKLQPIEIQRKWKLRKNKHTGIDGVFSTASNILSMGAKIGYAPDEATGACLYVDAVRA